MSYGSGAQKFSSNEKVELSLKTALQRVQTDLERKWFNEPNSFDPKTPQENFRFNVPNYNEIKDYLLIDPNVDGEGTSMITNVTVANFLGINDNGALFTLANIQSGLGDKCRSETSLTNANLRNYVDGTNGKQIKGLGPNMFTRYSYYKGIENNGSTSYFAGRKWKSDEQDIEEPFNSIINLKGNNTTEADSQRNIGFIQGSLGNPDAISTKFYNNVISAAVPISIIKPPTDWNSVDVTKSHPFIKVYIQVPTYASAVELNSDNIAFTNPVLKSGLGDTYGYQYFISGWNGSKYEKLTTLANEFLFYNSTAGIITVYGQSDPINGTRMSQKYPPMVSFIRYTGETLGDGIISQGPTLPAPELLNNKDLFINTSENTIHRLKDDGVNKEWISIGGSGNSDISFNDTKPSPVPTDFEENQLFVDTSHNIIFRVEEDDNENKSFEQISEKILSDVQDPSGIINGYEGQLYIRKLNPAKLYYNNGGTQWLQISGSGGGGANGGTQIDNDQILEQTSNEVIEVTGEQSLGTDNSDISGSSVSYIFPPGAIKVIYRFRFNLTWNDINNRGDTISEYKLQISSNDGSSWVVLKTFRLRNSVFSENFATIEHVIKKADYNNITIKLVGRSINPEFQQKIHYSYLLQETPEVVNPILELVTLGTRTIQGAPLFSKNPNSNIFYTDGNVGIGTDDPKFNLHVSASDYSITDNNITTPDNTDPTFYVYSGNAGGSVYKHTNTTVSIVERSLHNSKSIFRHDYGMVLGIGAHPTIGFKTKTSSKYPTGIIELAYGYSTTNNMDKISNTKVVIDAGGLSYFNGGNVGIGKTNPDYKLDVIDNARISKKINLNITNLKLFNMVQTISCGDKHSAILLNSGKVMTFGYNSYGQLGVSVINKSQKPEPVITGNQYNGSNAISVSCGHEHTAILLNNGTVITFGRNGNGQLGNTITGYTPTPTVVQSGGDYNGSNAISVSCGGTVAYGSHTAILLDTGGVVTFGSNKEGQLGLGTNVYGNLTNNQPQNVHNNAGYNGSNAIAISCGGAHTAILLDYGKVVTFGNNNFGQLSALDDNGNLLGLGIEEYPRTLNYKVKPDEDSEYDQYNAVSVSCGIFQTAILLSNGRVYTFGSGGGGRLGNGETSGNFSYLQEVNNGGGYDGSNAIGVSCGGLHTAILLNTGKTVICGNNNNLGILGLGTLNTEIQSTPTQINISNVNTINCGDTHNLILLNTGEVVSFGENDKGQLGLNKIQSSGGTDVPTQLFKYEGEYNLGEYNLYNKNGAIPEISKSSFTIGEWESKILSYGFKNSNIRFSELDNFGSKLFKKWGDVSLETVANDENTINSTGNIILSSRGNIERQSDKTYFENRERSIIRYADRNYRYNSSSNPGETHKITFGYTDEYFTDEDKKYPQNNAIKFKLVDGHSSSTVDTKMIISGNGFVGIGTDSPTHKLDVFGSISLYGNDGTLPLNTYTLPDIILDCKTGGDYSGSNGIVWKTRDANYSKFSAKIVFEPDGSSYNGGLTFYTGNVDNATTDAVERMRIDKKGNVGIGTDDPKSKFHIHNSSTNWEEKSTIRLSSDSLSNTFSEISYYRGTNFAGNSYDGDDEALRFEHLMDGNSRTDLCILKKTGYVGIGLIDPIYPLVVRGSNHTLTYNNVFAFSSKPISGAGSSSFFYGGTRYTGISILTSDAIVCPALLSTSDERIKINIRDISDNISLQKLRDISCCLYEYKDPLSRDFYTQIGFIAQQVYEHFPLAISFVKDIIPNEMRIIENPQWSKIIDGSNNKFKLTIPDLEDVSGNTKYKFYMSNDVSGNDECEKISSTLADERKSFIFDQSWNYVYLYGKEVDDFHRISKDKLFALNFSATQEIDKIQQQQLLDISGNTLNIAKNETDIELLKLENSELKTENAELKTELATLKTQMTDVLSRLSQLESN